MADDIVTRLRHQWTGEYDPTGKMLAEAADEIERLRVKIGSLIKAMHKLTEEAYRGE